MTRKPCLSKQVTESEHINFEALGGDIDFTFIIMQNSIQPLCGLRHSDIIFQKAQSHISIVLCVSNWRCSALQKAGRLIVKTANAAPCNHDQPLACNISVKAAVVAVYTGPH